MNIKDYQLYTWTQINVKEQLVVRKDMDVNEHKRLSNITLGLKLSCSQKGYGRK